MQPVPHSTPDTTAHLPRLPSNDDLTAFYGEGKAWMLWDDKEAWAIRSQVEGSFYADLLRKHAVCSVIDVAAASGFHVINLALAGFSAAAVDGFEGFVAAGRRNVEDAMLRIPFRKVLWGDLSADAGALGSFDSALCLGSSLHHTDGQGVAELFRNVRRLLNPGGKFIVEQRNYERLFRERPHRLDHPCGWSYSIDYPDSRTVMFHLKDARRGLNTSTATTITLEDELLSIANQAGYILSERYLDYGKRSDREQSWWIQYVFEKRGGEP
jgi:SAM-dependent methyltransferase